MNPEELVAEMYKAEELFLSPDDLWNHRVLIAQRHLREAYAKGRRESTELSDQFGYERNVNKFVKDCLRHRTGNGGKAK